MASIGGGGGGPYHWKLSRGAQQATWLAGIVITAVTGSGGAIAFLIAGDLALTGWLSAVIFIPSLALALGVADTVQAHAGGVHLDALFIDEGFGTLDPDNLQLAMDELDRLRSGGRMIGVISHVAALKERIRAGIAITAAESGSRATVCRTPLA